MVRPILFIDYRFPSLLAPPNNIRIDGQNHDQIGDYHLPLLGTERIRNPLYKWWQEERSRRPNPLDGVPVPPDEHFMPPKNGVMLDPEADLEKYPEFYAALEKKQDLEREWYEEDQKNLERLVAVRSVLWT